MVKTPLYVVKYFKGEETRTISKHAEYNPAFQMASRFVNNLKRKHNENAEHPVIISYSKTQESDTRMTLSSRRGTLAEGVTVTIETTIDPAWDYARYERLRRSDSGHMTTAVGSADSVRGDEQ
mgnify:CR=1 FL=1